MFLTIILTVCLETVMVNKSNEPWKDIDYRAKRGAERTCKARYQPCLKKFIKLRPREYHSICGPKKGYEKR